MRSLALSCYDRIIDLKNRQNKGAGLVIAPLADIHRNLEALSARPDDDVTSKPNPGTHCRMPQPTRESHSEREPDCKTARGLLH